MRRGLSLPLRLFILPRAALSLLRLPSVCCTFTHRYKTVYYYTLSLAIYQEDSGVCSISILVFLHAILESVHQERNIYLVKTLEVASNPLLWTQPPEVFSSLLGQIAQGFQCPNTHNSQLRDFLGYISDSHSSAAVEIQTAPRPARA